MFKSRRNFFIFGIMGFMCQFNGAQKAMALEFKISPFALYEQGQENIYIDGVRTKYGLGVLGVAGETMLGSDFSVRGRLGYGYHPKARVSLSVDSTEVAVTGPVEGLYLEAAVDYLVLSRPMYSLTSELMFISRNIDASDLTGFAGSRAITGTAVNDFDTLDLTLKAKFVMGKKAFLNISGGLSQWHLKTTAVAHSATGGSGPILCPCSYTKKIDTTSVDPVMGISIISNNPLHNVGLEFYNRSLESKAGTQIFGIELEYMFQF